MRTMANEDIFCAENLTNEECTCGDLPDKDGQVHIIEPEVSLDSLSF